MSRLSYIWILIFALSIGSALGQDIYIPHFTTKNGLPGNNCYFSMQDTKGFIWIGTDAGVSRFDGRNFENYTVENGLPDNQVLQIKEDKQGRIWFLSLSGQMSYYKDGLIFNSENDKLLKAISINTAIISFLQDSKGRIWLGTNKNMLVMYDGKTLHTFKSEHPSTQFINTYVHEDVQGTVRAYSTQAIHVYNGTSFKVEETKELPLSYKTFNATPDGKILFLKKDGLYQKSGPYTLIKQKIDTEFLAHDPGYFYSDEKEIWLSTIDGVFVIEPNSSYRRYLTGIAINQTMKDKDGNFWFTSSNGIYKLPVESQRLYIVNTHSGLKSKAVKSISLDSKANYWLGLENGSIIQLNKSWKIVSEINFKDKNKYQKIKQLTFNHTGNKLFFASDFGFGLLTNVYSHKPTLSYLKEVKNSQFAIKNFTLLEDQQKIAIAFSSGVALIADKLPLSFNTSAYVENKNFFKDRAYRVYYDSNKALWFSNTNGLSEFKSGILKSTHYKNTFQNKRINDIAKIQNGLLAVATDGFGIYIYNNHRKIRHITTTDGLSSNICYKLFFKNNTLWSVNNNGVNKINISNTSFDILTYEYASDLLSTDINDLYISDSTAYFATDEGLVYFSLINESVKDTQIPIYLTSVSIDGKNINITQNNTILPSSNTTILFNFSAIDFKNKTRIYRYRLKPNAPWKESKTRRIEISSLEPGNYTFEIAAKNAESDWGKSIAFNFSVEKRFWQTIWFWILLSSISAFLLFKIAVNITRKQKNKEKLQLSIRNKILTLEQQALQALMNPHFIFNIMNSIQHFINTQDKNAANKMLTGFARLIRKNLEICTKSYLSLEEELEYLNLYLNLEKSRFVNKFDYSIQVSEEIDVEDIFIPSMLLQPFIENAIWHGIIPSEHPGLVSIEISLADDVLQVLINDNGVGFENSIKKRDQDHISKGMQLTKDRIKIINSIEQNNIQLSIKQLGNSGTEVKILIPNRERLPFTQ